MLRSNDRLFDFHNISELTPQSSSVLVNVQTCEDLRNKTQEENQRKLRIIHQVNKALTKFKLEINQSEWELKVISQKFVKKEVLNSKPDRN